MGEVQLLISGYLDGELTGEEREQLARALEHDARRSTSWSTTDLSTRSCSIG